MKSTILILGTPEHINTMNDLGFELEWFDEIGQRVLTSFLQATPNDAANVAGTYAYLAAVRAVRDILCTNGWEKQREHNLELTVLTEREIVLLVSSGDKYTGHESYKPHTKNPKGTQTQKVVDQNYRQRLFPWEKIEPKACMSLDKATTWILLYHIDTKNKEIRMEVSLPISFDIHEFKVNGWEKRVILPSIKFDETPKDITPEFAPESNIEIKLRGNK
jgi:hypothetical protein